MPVVLQPRFPVMVLPRQPDHLVDALRVVLLQHIATSNPALRTRPLGPSVFGGAVLVVDRDDLLVICIVLTVGIACCSLI